MEPPLSQPHAYTCRQCGHGWDFAQKYCPHCGAEYYRTVRGVPQEGNCCQAGCLALGGIFVGALGACVAVADDLGSGSLVNSVTVCFFIAMAGASCLFLFYIIIKARIGK